MAGMFTRRPHLVALALLVAVFVAFYPYLEPAGSCGAGGCPQLSQAHAPSSPNLPAGDIVAVLAAPASVATLRAAGFLRPASDRHPEEVHLSPDSPPPRH